jgi:phospholipid/cholesterol/gamma-HCH transport system substrate-binding protein
MISRLTRIQLVIFAIVTVIGGAFVGGRYAQIDRLVIDRTYEVSAQFSDSGGIFSGAQVTYRGIEVGRVGKLTFTPDGVRARLDIENSAPKIPSDVTALVANKSAIGEQYVDLQPKTNDAPYLADGSEITLANTKIPLDTTTLLIDLNDLVSSVDTQNLSTVVSELGQAFEGTGDDLSTILDTSNEFITTAEDNIDVTRSLIQDSDLVLQTQIDKQGELSTFSKNLALLSDSLVDADPDLRRLVDQGTVSARNLDQLVSENADDLTVAINNLVTAGKPLKKNVLGLRGIFTLYPFLIEGSYSVLAPSEVDPGEYDAEFGLVLDALTKPPCTEGYRDRRPSADITDVQFPTPVGIDCTAGDNDIARQSSKTEFNRTAPADSGKDALSWLLLDPVNR